MDKMQNFVVGDIVTAPSPASSGTSVTVNNGSYFPDPSTFGDYNLVMWDRLSGEIPTTSNCEIVRVTAKTTDDDNAILTITRAQESTSAKELGVNWRVYMSPTQKYFDDLKTYIDNLQLTKENLADATLINDTTNTNSYEGTFAEPLTSYETGLIVNLKVTNGNTGAATLNIDSLGVKSIKKNVSDDLSSGDIQAGQVVPLVYDGTNWQIVGGGGGTSLEKASGSDINTGTDDAKFVTSKAIAESNLREGYRYLATRYFTSSGTFSKSDSLGDGSNITPKAIRVKCQGGGGAGGGASSGFPKGGGGGAGGGYAESFITNIADLSSSVTVTVGAGGTGTTGDGNAGGNSSFGSIVIGNGGGGAEEGGTIGKTGTGGTGDFIIYSQGGGAGSIGSTYNGIGGSSHLGGGGRGTNDYSGANDSGWAGYLYGGGGNGCRAASSSQSGGAGAAGIVIVEIYI